MQRLQTSGQLNAACHAACPPRRLAGPARLRSACSDARPGAAIDTVDHWYSQQLPERLVGPVEAATFEGKGRGVRATQVAAAGEALLAVPPLALLSVAAQERPHPADLVDVIVYATVARARASGADDASDAAGGASSSGSSAAEGGVTGGRRLGRGGKAPTPQLDPQLSPWYGQLYDGSSASMQTLPNLLQPPALLPAVRLPGQAAAAADAAAAAAASAASSSGAGGAMSPGVRTVAARVARTKAASKSPAQKQMEAATKQLGKKVARVVQKNAFGDAHGDLALGAVAGGAPEGHIGLWPEFALLNHSCSPNAINFVHGQSMLVRAARPIAAGAEVTISYLGRPQLQPLPQRQAVLKRDFGFECSCERCVGEGSAWDRVGQQVEALHSQVTDVLVPAMEAAQAAGDAAALHDVRTEAAAALQRLYDRFRKTLLPPTLRRYLLGSCYGVLEVVADADVALGSEDAAASVGACVASCASVTPGSDLAVITAAMQLSVVQQAAGLGAEITALSGGVGLGLGLAQAQAAALAAHRVRYGPVSEQLAAQLAEANRQLYV